jgi:hypothetical protein
VCHQVFFRAEKIALFDKEQCEAESRIYKGQQTRQGLGCNGLAILKILLHRLSSLGHGDEIGGITCILGHFFNTLDQVDDLFAVSTLVLGKIPYRIFIELQDFVNRLNVTASDILLDQLAGLLLKGAINENPPGIRCPLGGMVIF